MIKWDPTAGCWIYEDPFALALLRELQERMNSVLDRLDALENRWLS